MSKKSKNNPLPPQQTPPSQMKIMVIGGAGFIGSHIVKKLLARGFEVIIYDKFFNFLEPARENYIFYLPKRLAEIGPTAKIVYGDIRDGGVLAKTLKEYRPNIIIHLAQIPLATVSNKLSAEAIDINVNGLTSLIKVIGSVDFVERLV